MTMPLLNRLHCIAALSTFIAAPASAMDLTLPALRSPGAMTLAQSTKPVDNAHDHDEEEGRDTSPAQHGEQHDEPGAGRPPVRHHDHDETL